MSAAHAALLPHTGLARLLRTIRESDASSIDATGEIPAAHPLVRDGRAPAFLAIELGAQAAAAMSALAGQGEGGSGPIRGRLVRVTVARFLQATLPVDTSLDVTARLVASAAPLAIYDVDVACAGAPQVTATISTYALPPQTGE